MCEFYWQSCTQHTKGWSRISGNTETWAGHTVCVKGSGWKTAWSTWMVVCDWRQSWGMIVCENELCLWLGNVRKEGIILFGLIAQTRICGCKLLSWLFCKVTRLLACFACSLGFGIKEICLEKRESPTDFFTTFGDFSHCVGLISSLHFTLN